MFFHFRTDPCDYQIELLSTIIHTYYIRIYVYIYIYIYILFTYYQPIHIRNIYVYKYICI